MNVIDRIRAMKVSKEEASEAGKNFEKNLAAIEPTIENQFADELGELSEKTRRKAGNMAAFGMSDTVIGDALGLTVEQVLLIRATKEFKSAYTAQLGERAQQAIDLADGWNAVETQGLTRVLQALQHSSDPDFALRAALIANKATRRTPADMGRVIDASKAGNVVMLTMNNTYIQNVSGGKGRGVIDATPVTKVADLPRRLADVPNPKQVAQILGIAGGVMEDRPHKSRIEQLADEMGITTDLIELEENA